MFVRRLEDIERTPNFVQFGNGTSHRFVTAIDKMGFSVCHTVVLAGTQSHLQYLNHLEACYCISGSGEIEDDQGTVHRIEPGTLYALDAHDRHYLRADPGQDLVLLSVFNPPLSGCEVHDLSGAGASSYQALPPEMIPPPLRAGV